MIVKLNKFDVAINGRRYTLMSNESPEYMNKLAEHINEKVEYVRKYTPNTMGERPIVLAALNICDEYYKALEAGTTIGEQTKRLNDKITNLAEENKRLHELFDNNEFELDIKTLQSEVERNKEIIEQQRDKIRHLENSLESMRLKNEKDIEALKKQNAKN